MPKKYAKFVAVLLLLVFLQKAGTGLWAHNWLHINSKETAQSHCDGKGHLVELKCNCLDDFFTPYTVTDIALPIFEPRQYASYILTDNSGIFSILTLHPSLRAPPIPQA